MNRSEPHVHEVHIVGVNCETGLTIQQQKIMQASCWTSRKNRKATFYIAIAYNRE